MRANPRALDWSPDGKRIVFEDIHLPDTSFDFDLSIINVDGTGYRRFTNIRDRQIWEPSVSPDGRTVAVSYTRSSNESGLALIDIATGGIRTLTSPVGDDSPFWVWPDTR